jgi:protocatechuate 3,4-dioxygenase beta subunit
VLSQFPGSSPTVGGMNESPHTKEHLISRRASLVKAGGLVAAALGAGAWKAGAFADESIAATDGTGPAAVAAGLVTCVLTPEQTEGPYYIAGDKVRRTITEGRAGVALTLRLTVVDASTCKPIKGAAVDVWHCDAAGIYSGVEAQNTVGQTFLRGIQKTNANGLATFQTIYPGWYRGRTVHIHVRVHIGGNIVHTGQLYFPDAVTDTVYERAPYSSRPGRDTRNAPDNVYRNGGSKSLMTVKRSGAGYVASVAMGVSRS